MVRRNNHPTFGEFIVGKSNYVFTTNYVLNSNAYPTILDQNRNIFRALSIQGSHIVVTLSPSGEGNWKLTSGTIEAKLIESKARNIFRVIALSDLNSHVFPDGFRSALHAYNSALHISSASLTEAVVKAVIRQVISATQAKILIQRLIDYFGTRVPYQNNFAYCFPTIEESLKITERQLRDMGLGYKAELIPRIIRALVDTELEEKHELLSTNSLLSELTNIKGIGEWTARIAVCDLRGDWSIYPFGDLAVRKWAKIVWPSKSWPEDPNMFAEEWVLQHGDCVGPTTCFLLTVVAHYKSGGEA